MFSSVDFVDHTTTLYKLQRTLSKTPPGRGEKGVTNPKDSTVFSRPLHHRYEMI